jgi:hypothetical protein
LTAFAAEVCRVGYIPTEEEILAGSVDPSYDPTLGCNGINSDRLWACQVRGLMSVWARARACTLTLPSAPVNPKP